MRNITVKLTSELLSKGYLSQIAKLGLANDTKNSSKNTSEAKADNLHAVDNMVANVSNAAADIGKSAADAFAGTITMVCIGCAVVLVGGLSVTGGIGSTAKDFVIKYKWWILAFVIVIVIITIILGIVESQTKDDNTQQKSKLCPYHANQQHVSPYVAT